MVAIDRARHRWRQTGRRVVPVRMACLKEPSASVRPVVVKVTDGSVEDAHEIGADRLAV